MKLIDKVLIKDLGFCSTTNNQSVYIKKIDGHILLLHRQVDDFCCASCTQEQETKDIFNIIGTNVWFKFEGENDDIYHLNI